MLIIFMMSHPSHSYKTTSSNIKLVHFPPIASHSPSSYCVQYANPWCSQHYCVQALQLGTPPTYFLFCWFVSHCASSSCFVGLCISRNHILLPNHTSARFDSFMFSHLPCVCVALGLHTWWQRWTLEAQRTCNLEAQRCQYLEAWLKWP